MASLESTRNIIFVDWTSSSDIGKRITELRFWCRSFSRTSNVTSCGTQTLPRMKDKLSVITCNIFPQKNVPVHQYFLLLVYVSETISTPKNCWNAAQAFCPPPDGHHWLHTSPSASTGDICYNRFLYPPIMHRGEHMQRKSTPYNKLLTAVTVKDIVFTDYSS